MGLCSTTLQQPGLDCWKAVAQTKESKKTQFPGFVFRKVVQKQYLDEMRNKSLCLFAFSVTLLPKIVKSFHACTSSEFRARRHAHAMERASPSFLPSMPLAGLEKN